MRIEQQPRLTVYPGQAQCSGLAGIGADAAQCAYTGDDNARIGKNWLAGAT